jgi:hypothetical protein
MVHDYRAKTLKSNAPKIFQGFDRAAKKDELLKLYMLD